MHNKTKWSISNKGKPSHPPPLPYPHPGKARGKQRHMRGCPFDRRGSAVTERNTKNATIVYKLWGEEGRESCWVGSLEGKKSLKGPKWWLKEKRTSCMLFLKFVSEFSWDGYQKYFLKISSHLPSVFSLLFFFLFWQAHSSSDIFLSSKAELYIRGVIKIS